MHLVTNLSTAGPVQLEVRRFCSACGHQNPAQAPICQNCAVALTRDCPSCGTQVSPASKFCGQCGSRLNEPPAVQPRQNGKSAQLPAHMPKALAQKIKTASVKNLRERREVTVLFLDVANFTMAAHHLDSEDVYLFIDEAMSLLAEVIYKYEGTIDKFTGDGLMALFGAPIAHENDPERAIRAGLEMQQVLIPLRERIKSSYGFDFNTRIGIHTGPAIAGNLGSNLHKEYTVIGDTVNLAARLEAAAEPGTVLVSAETYQRTHPIFKFKPLPPLMVKGVPDPVQSFCPVALRTQPGLVRGLAGLRSPMIGRVDDLAQLQQALKEMCQTKQGRVALVTGEAGLGKSRLVMEFRRLVKAPTQVYQGNCLTYARSTPFWVIKDLLRNMLGLSVTDTPDFQRANLQDKLEQLGLHNDKITPYLFYILGLEQPDPAIEQRLALLDADMLQRQTHAALRQVLQAHAHHTPTVLIFEDLHWVDPASRDFLEYFIQNIGDVSLLLILISRELERKTIIHPLIAAARQTPLRLIDLPLHALSETEGILLANHLIAQDTREAQKLKQQIVKRSDGNPFFTEEIIRMLIDQGALISQANDPAWLVVPQATDLLKAVPGTLRGLILARFDSLPESVRQTLQKVAVLGTSFPTRLLHLLNGISPQILQTHLDELELRQFLIVKSFRSEPGYIFRHTLLQETIYDTLLKRDRRRIHTQAAQAIEADQLWDPEEQVELLAHHYAKSDHPEQAVPYLMTAAKNAGRRCAYETAAEHYRQAVELLRQQPNAHDQVFFQARIGLGQSLKYLGEFSEAHRILRQVLTLLWGSSIAADSAILWPILVECLRQLADVHQREGLYKEALAYLEAGLQVLGTNGAEEQPRLWFSLLDRMAWIRFRQGQLEEAAALAKTATRNQSSLNSVDPVRMASLYNTLGGVYWQQGDLNQSIECVEHSLTLYEQVGYLWGQAIAYGNLGVLYDNLGKWTRAIDYYQRSYRLQESIGDRQNLVVNLINLGVVHSRIGNHQAAQCDLKTGLTIARQLGDTWGTALCYANLAELNIIQANFTEARENVDHALAIADEIGSSEIQVQARRFLSMILAHKNEAQAGLIIAQQALSMAKTTKLLAEEANCYRVLGILYTQGHQFNQAEMHLRHSASLALQQNDPYRQGLALLELGTMYKNQAQIQADAPNTWQHKTELVLQEAAQQFTALGAAHDLALTQDLLAQIKG